MAGRLQTQQATLARVRCEISQARAFEALAVDLEQIGGMPRESEAARKAANEHLDRADVIAKQFGVKTPTKSGANS
jgi:hypothetical protein